MRHRTTDPGCIHHRWARTRLGLWRFNRARGKSCPVCFPTLPRKPMLTDSQLETRRIVARIIDQHYDSQDELFDDCVEKITLFVITQQRAAAWSKSRAARRQLPNELPTLTRENLL